MTIFLTSQSTTVCMKAATLKGKKRAVHKKAAKERINSPTAWLTDDIIEAAQCLIQENNPLVGGLQPPYLRQTCLLTMETGKFIQVVRNGADHWLVVTNIGVRWCMTAYTSALPQVQNSK